MYKKTHAVFLHADLCYLTTEMSRPMKQGYAFGTRIRLSEEIIKTLKITSCLITIYFESNFG